MKEIVFILLTLIFSEMSALSQEKEKNKSEFPLLDGTYLGQKPPGMTPEVFAPDIVSTKDHLEFGCTWSPNCKEFYFTRRGGDYQYNTIMVCYWSDSLLTEPKIVSFSDPYPKMSPRYFLDGSKFVYTAWRPPNQDTNYDSPFSLWITEKFERKWKDPEYFQPWFSMSISDEGLIYCHSNKGIGISIEEEGNYQEPKILGNEINSGHFDQHPFVSPDGTYFVFDSHRPEGYGDSDLYVAFRDKNNSYTVLNLGESINNDKPNFSPMLSPNGKYLFYTNGENIYWVDVKIIDRLKPF